MTDQGSAIKGVVDDQYFFMSEVHRGSWHGSGEIIGIQ
jgi:hypothetical protein